MAHPRIIQGGMGVGVSGWRLARAVAEQGALGVVSGTGLNTVLARRLQSGDAGGHLRRSLEHFPVPAIADGILRRYYRPQGKGAGESYRLAPLFRLSTDREGLELTVAANFAEVFLARQGHDGVVGINYLEKIQLPHLPSLYGAMLAGVDYVLMGAGIPRQIPGALDALSQHQPTAYRIQVEGAESGDETCVPFDPRQVVGEVPRRLERPFFLAIISSAVLALTLARKATGRVDGFIVEGPTAGGHNAPPRGPAQRNPRGEPVYGPKDEVDLEQIRALGRPFWLAGGFAGPDRLRQALAAGATGIQVGTAFSLCQESEIEEALKSQVLQRLEREEIAVYTDAQASPTGFPFKVIPLDGTASEAAVYERRPRICDLGYLRVAYKRQDGGIDFRCAAEPVESFVKKGGDPAETVGRKCLCNALMANIGVPQVRADGYVEPPLLTAGDDLNLVRRFVHEGKTTYSAAEVLEYLEAQG